tara:strand:- start:318 stop:1340 length:1023 start_codon:yes stop_codon:yes gene_type:complete
MIKIDPIGYEGFKVSHVVDEECGFESVIAISDNNKKPLVEVKFQSFTSKNQQIDATTKYAKALDKKFRYAGLNYDSGIITINTDLYKNKLSAINKFVEFISNQYKDQIILYVTQELDYDFEYHLKQNCPQFFDIDNDAYVKAQSKGVFYSLRALQQFLYSSKSLQHKHVVVKGLDKIGSEVARLVDKNKANLTVCDSDQQKINDLYANAYFGTCKIEEAHKVPSDIYILCDGQDYLDRNITMETKALNIIGVSDGQLASNKAGYNMHTKKIVYVPDYVAGAGGVIMIAKHIEDSKKSLEKELDKIFTRTLSLLNHSSKLRKPPFIVAEQQLQEKQKKEKV